MWQSQQLPREMLGGSWSPAPPACHCRYPAMGRGTLAVLGIHLPTDGAPGLGSTSTCQCAGGGWAVQPLGAPAEPS